MSIDNNRDFTGDTGVTGVTGVREGGKLSKSYTQMTLQFLRKEGFTVDIVERWNEYSGCRNDMFGFGDIIALDSSSHRIIAVQSTGPNGHAEHKRKIQSEPRANDWLLAGGEILLISWRKLCLLKKDGRKGKTRTWCARVESITIDMLTPLVPGGPSVESDLQPTCG